MIVFDAPHALSVFDDPAFKRIRDGFNYSIGAEGRPDNRATLWNSVREGHPRSLPSLELYGSLFFSAIRSPDELLNKVMVLVQGINDSHTSTERNMMVAVRLMFAMKLRHFLLGQGTHPQILERGIALQHPGQEDRCYRLRLFIQAVSSSVTSSMDPNSTFGVRVSHVLGLLWLTIV